MCKKAIAVEEATGGIFYTKDEEARRRGALLCSLFSTQFLFSAVGDLKTCSRP